MEAHAPCALASRVETRDSDDAGSSRSLRALSGEVLSPESIRSLIREGVLQGTRHPRRNEWKIKISKEDEARLKQEWRQQSEWTVKDLARRLGIPAWRVYYWLDQGSIEARRTQVGRRGRLFLPEKEVQKLEQRLASNNPS